MDLKENKMKKFKMIDVEEQREMVWEIVRDYFNDNSMHVGLHKLFEDSVEHVIDTGASILCTKWGIGYEGGSFVQAVVANDLMRAVGSADYINANALKFYTQLMYNVGKPIWNESTTTV